MKAAFLTLTLVLGSLVLPSISQAKTEFGTLQDVRCFSVFEGQTKEYVNVTDVKRDGDGYVTNMTLKGIWYDKKNQQHFAAFTVLKISNSNNTLSISGASPGGHRLDLQIELSADGSSDNTFNEATMSVNGQQAEFLKFGCSVTRAG
jgi:hypothetical protein